MGFAYNRYQVKVVELLSVKPLMINALQSSEDGGVQARGIMLSKEVGLYAGRIVDPKHAKNEKKDISLVGPPNIQMDKTTNEFLIQFPPVDDVFYNPEPKQLEIYIRRAHPERIKFGVPSNDRIKVKDLECVLRLPMEYLPDPRTVIEDANDR